MNIKTRWFYGLGAVLAITMVLGAIFMAPGAAGSSNRLALNAPGGAASASSNVGQAVASGPMVPEVVTAVKSDLSPELRSITPIPPAKDQEFNDPDKARNLLVPNGFLGKQTNLSGFVDPVLQDALMGNNLPAPLLSFDGVGNLFGGWPPDTEGDVGPNNYVQWINLSFAIYSKTGTLQFGPAAGNTLWSGFGGICQTNNNGDPIVLYDAMADRWFMSQFAFPATLQNNFHTCIAVSQTGDPLGAWFRYDFLYSNTKLNDYPKFGVWPDGYYMTVNQFNGGTLTWGGQGVAVFERDQMLVGGAARMVKFDLASTDINLGGMLPSDLDGATLPAAGEPNHFSEMDDDSGGVFPDQLQIWDFHVDWANTANSTFTHIIDLPVAAFDSNMCNFSRNCIPQPSTTQKLDAISDRLMYRLQYRNFGSYQTLVTNHTVDVGADHAGVRWYELRNTGAGWSVFQQGTYAPDASHRWMGSIAMNGKGEIALGFSNSSTTIFPSVRYTARVATDPLGTMPQGEGTIVAGSGSQTDSSFHRWGDYSTMSVDPVDDCTFWYTQEWIQTTGTSSWKTRIGSFQVTNCGGATNGTLQGTVTDASTSAPISGALVDAGGGFSANTDGNGFYQIANIPAGTYNVTASATGYNSSTVNGVVVTAGNTTTQDFALTPVAGCTTNCLRVTAIQMKGTTTTVRARVTVKNEAGLAVSGARVTVHWDLPGGGTADQSRNTNTNGIVNFQVSGGAGTYTITVTNITKTGFTFDPAGSTILTKSLTK